MKQLLNPLLLKILLHVIYRWFYLVSEEKNVSLPDSKVYTWDHSEKHSVACRPLEVLSHPHLLAFSSWEQCEKTRLSSVTHQGQNHQRIETRIYLLHPLRL